MKFEYHSDSLALKVLDTSHTGEVLDFYKRNKESFEKYETDKPSNFYTYTFIYNLLKAEYSSCLHGKHIRFFLYDYSVSDKIIGSVSFTDIKTNMKSCIIGYKIDEAFRHMGYGRRMLTMSLKIMVTECGMHRIEAYILPDNTPSIQLAKTMGFLSEGTAYAYAKINNSWRDHLRFTYIS